MREVSFDSDGRAHSYVARRGASRRGASASSSVEAEWRYSQAMHMLSTPSHAGFRIWNSHTKMRTESIWIMFS